MKKILVALTILSAVVSSHAQGFVLFQNAGNTRVSTNGAVAGRVSANDGTTANSYYFALFTSTADNTTVAGSSAAVSGVGNYVFNNSTGWTAVTGLATNGPVGGQFQSSVADPNNSGQTQLASGAAQTFVIVGWSASDGTTLAQLMIWYNNGNPLTAGYIGESVVSGILTPSAGGASPTVAITGTTGGTIPGFTLGLISPAAVVPEPGTMALAGLGGLSLLAFRRKK